jgi:hypothetical protein
MFIDLNDKVISAILKDKKNNIIFTGIVDSLSPLSIKLYPGDSSIYVSSIIGLIGLSVGSNVLLIKYMNKFIIVGVLGTPTNTLQESFKIATISATESFTNNTFVNTGLEFDFDSNSSYYVEALLSFAGASAAGVKTDWVNTGSIPANQVRKCIGMAFGQTNRDSATVVCRQSYFTTTISYGIESSANFIKEEFILNTTNAGTFTLRAAKSVSTGVNTDLSAGSYLKYTKLS